MSSDTTLSASTTVVANDDCLSTEIDGESVILHMEQGKYYGFNEVGTRVWDLTQEPHRLEEIYRAILESYDVDEERCRSDVRELIAELIEMDLVQTVD
jgi:hypothetical protein